MQLCSEILDSLKDGKFGAEGVSCADDYRRKCASHFEMSSLFSDSVPAAAAASADDNSNQQEGDEVNSNNTSAVSKGEQKTDKVTAATSTNKNSSHLNSKTVTTAS